MSRIASNPSTAGKPRRITANWEFEHSNSCSEQIIITPSDVKLGSGMTDARDRKPSKWEKSTNTSARQGAKSMGSEYHLPRRTINFSHDVPSEDSSNECTNDGTDSGLGSATMLSSNQEILEYMAENLMHYMNPTLLVPQLKKQGLLTEEDAAYIRSSQHSDEEKKDRVLCALVLQEADATLERLMVCLAEDSVHSNHCYMARKLREALDAKRQHPELQLSSQQQGAPPYSAKDPSPPAAPIKPRGAPQRNSIAKLLATKKNNVANLISQIEIKQPTQPQQQQARRSSRPTEPTQELRSIRINNNSIHKHERVRHTENMTTDYENSLNESSVSPTTEPYHHPTPPFSPPHTHPQSILYSQPRCKFPTTHPVSPIQSHSQTTVLKHPHSHPISPLQNQPCPVSPSHFNYYQTPYSYPYHQPLSPTYPLPQPVLQSKGHASPHQTTNTHSIYHSPPHTQMPTPPHSHSPPYTSSPSHSQSPHHISTPPLPHTPPSLSGDSQEETHSIGSPAIPHKSSKRCRPVNEVVLRQASVPHGDLSSPTGSPRITETAIGSPKENEKGSKWTSSAKSQRKSVPDLLSSPKSPNSPKTPMLPSVNTSKPKYIHPSPYTEISADELPSSTTYSPETRVDDDLIENDVEQVQHRNRTTRLAGLTARFYKHRRSASMSSYDTRTFKRGDQLYASEGKGREERSTFHQKYGNTQTTNIRASVREGAEKLVKRRIDWLQERVQFTDCPEHVQFMSQTHYGEERELLYSGTLNKHGKARFVVLFTDYLLVLRARRPIVPSKLGGVFSFQQSSRIDWFSELEYTAKKPLPLHLLTVQHQSSKQNNDTFYLHFNDKNKVMEVVLQAVSKEARDIWVEELSEAITLATSAHADTFVLVGNRALTKNSGEPYKKLQLQIHSASSLGLAANCNSFSLFCVIELGKQRCRTPSVMGGYNPSWGYKCEFTDFNDDDNLLIEVFSENIFRPNDFLGCVNVMLSNLPREQSGCKVFDGNMVLAGLEEAFAGELHIAIEQGWETKM